MFFRKLSKLRNEVTSNFFSILSKCFFPYCFQNSQTNSAMNMTASECIEVNLLYFIKNGFSGNNSTNGESITDTFSHSNDVRFDSLPPMTPIFSTNSSKSSLNFVANNQSSMSISNKINKFREISFRKWVDSSNTLNALEYAASQLSI